MTYEEKRQARIERLKGRADKAHSEASQAGQCAQELASQIPFGQPILVGHHSEGMHRRHVKKIEGAMDKSVAADDKAKYYEGRVAAAENNRAISGDDPDALQKLEAKLADLERLQTTMREANKAIRKNDDDRLRELGLSDEQIGKLKEPDFCGRIGFPDYALTNNNANIKRVKKRVEEMKAREGQETREWELAGGVTLIDNVEANRVQLVFPGKPEVGDAPTAQIVGLSLGAERRRVADAPFADGVGSGA